MDYYEPTTSGEKSSQKPSPHVMHPDEIQRQILLAELVKRHLENDLLRAELRAKDYKPSV